MRQQTSHPQKQIVLIKVKDIPCSFSVERHSSHLMLTLPPCYSRSPTPFLALSVYMFGDGDDGNISGKPKAELTQIQTAYVKGAFETGVKYKFVKKIPKKKPTVV